ncbi:dipeptidyl-peptidase [Coprinopsis sp. MPI-PUGE-AT-0042]|nr:dipeptidyl-peptidase [Coprinopsis sp. MPI-PUGE-AT-0042]
MVRLSSEDNLLGRSSASTMEMRQTAASPGVSVDPALVRPQVYYNDGQFDAPSSSDEEAESLLDEEESPGTAELGLVSGRNTVDGRSMRPDGRLGSNTSLRWLVIGLVALVGLASGIGFIAALSYPTAPVVHGLKKFTMDHIFNGTFSAQSSVRAVLPADGLKKFTMDHIFNGTFSAQSQSVRWVPEAGDGVFSVSSSSSINLVDLKTNQTTTLVNWSDIKDQNGTPLVIADWQVSPDMKSILVKADYRKQWRHSSFGNYYVHVIASKETFPVIPPSNPSLTAYATWSPTGDAIAYVVENDLYILPTASPSAKSIRVTSSGNASLFHGVPDWVYEEEIFSSDFALWWSPDSNKVAFLAFDETAVPEYTFPIYNPTEDASTVVPYTTDVVMKYPKAGYPNPLVSVHVFDLARYMDMHPDADGEADADANADFPFPDETLTLDWDGRHAPKDSVIMDITWVSNNTLLLKEVNRNADDGSVVLFDLQSTTPSRSAQGDVVRKLGKNGEQGDDGWIDADQTVHPVNFEGAEPAYLDVVPSKEGFNHIALFSPATSGEPKWLTTGEWEVTALHAVDLERRLVYFIAAKPASTQRHLYSVQLPEDLSTVTATNDPTALTDASKPGYFSTNFSPNAGFYVLSYQGPNVPWQKIIQVGNTAFNYDLTTNDRLKNITAEYEAPTKTWSTIVSDGYELNAVELRPPHFDDSGRTQYPVLFHVYGGPFSQMVDYRFSRSSWANYVVCGLEYVLVLVDGRGTGYKGRKLRNTVKNNLGFFETIDQIEAGKQWAKKPYIDKKRIGIWGWSYGGFMSSKVVEANAGVHSLAMAVAPVTSWRLYDSIYTERYMNLPDLNPGGYVNASISNVTAFNNFNYLLAHGSGDDNVHYSNSAHLLDMFTQAKVRGFRFRMFTDSDHSIARRGANREIYEFLTSFLSEKWGKGPKKRGF